LFSQPSISYITEGLTFQYNKIKRNHKLAGKLNFLKGDMLGYLHFYFLVCIINIYFSCDSVLADGHVNWAFEAFTKYHCAELAESTSLAW